MINKGQIDIRQVRRTWINTNDGHVRNSHVQIPQINPRGVGQAETFASPLGPILYPGDPSALAANTIQCRCAVFARIISRGLIPGLEEPAPPPAPKPPTRRAPAAPKITDAERRRLVWANKTTDEQLNVAPAFMETDPARMAIIEKLGNLRGGVRFLNPGDVDANGKSIYGGAWHESRNLKIAMSERDTNLQDYQTVMRHEYGHHIDAVIDHHLLVKRGITQAQAEYLNGFASRRALAAIAADAKDLEKNLIKTQQSAWRPDSAPRSVSAHAAVMSAQVDMADELGLLDIPDAASAYAKLEAAFKKRGLDYAEAIKIAPSIGIPEGRAPGNDLTTFATVRRAAHFLVAYEKGDHHTLLTELASFSQGSLLTGLSDSIGAATIQRIGYQFGHTVDYYSEFLEVSKKLENYSSVLNLNDKYTYKKGKQEYGIGTSAQLFANWFEAWTSGNATQYLLFKQFFPRTSKIFEKMVKEALA
jgi:hypothetical protein